METSEHERVFGYDTGAKPAHPASLRPGYILEATPPRPWLSTPSPAPNNVAQPTRTRSVMYKARIHDFLIYASLIISVVALVMANWSSGGGDGSAEGVAEKVKDLVQVNAGNQVTRPEAIIHLKFPPQPPPQSPSLIMPIQKFLAYIQHDRSDQGYVNLDRLLNPSFRLSASELITLRDHVELVSHEEKAASNLLHRLVLDLDLDRDHERDPDHHGEHGRLHSILDLVRRDKKGHRKRLRELAEREEAVGEREKEVVDALNRLAKEREKE